MQVHRAVSLDSVFFTVQYDPIGLQGPVEGAESHGLGYGATMGWMKGTDYYKLVYPHNILS